MTQTDKPASPVGQQERIIILDSLRGIAILGILLMNIPGFALPAPAAYGDLTVLNELSTIDEKVWYFIEMTFAGSQRALFSMLFGAGMILFLAGKEKRLDGLNPRNTFSVVSFGCSFSDYSMPMYCFGSGTSCSFMPYAE